jgi:hypothetical protein
MIEKNRVFFLIKSAKKKICKKLLVQPFSGKKRQDEIVAELNQKVENTKEEVEKWKAQVSLAVKKVEELDSAREKAGMALSAQNKK